MNTNYLHLEKNRRPKQTTRIQYHNMLGRSRRKHHRELSFTLEDYRAWAVTHGFWALYEDWVDSEFDHSKSPSVNRIEDTLYYTFDNMELITWSENEALGNLNESNGKNTKRSNSVEEIDYEGNVVAEWYSQAEATRQTGIKLNGLGSKGLHTTNDGRWFILKQEEK